MPELNEFLPLTHSETLRDIALALLPKTCIERRLGASLVYGTQSPDGRLHVEYGVGEVGGDYEVDTLSIRYVEPIVVVRPEIVTARQEISDKIAKFGVQSLTEDELNLLWTDDSGFLHELEPWDKNAPLEIPKLSGLAMQSRVEIHLISSEVLTYTRVTGMANEYGFADYYEEMMNSAPKDIKNLDPFSFIVRLLTLDDDEKQMLRHSETFTGDIEAELVNATDRIDNQIA
ncbi:MAG: hypothetical protein M3Q70_03860 [bacterium]|nr:hypothetical protein [bacterium]